MGAWEFVCDATGYLIEKRPWDLALAVLCVVGIILLIVGIFVNTSVLWTGVGLTIATALVLAVRAYFWSVSGGPIEFTEYLATVEINKQYGQ